MDSRIETLRKLNDRLRRDHHGGKIILTEGILAKGADFITAVDTALTEFSFGPVQNMLDAHDYGVIVVQGERVVFKIDYLDLSGRRASPDPADDKLTQRILTIMLGEEC